MNTPEEDDEPTIKGINAADLLARGLESAKAATGNPQAWQPPTPEELAALLPQYEIESLLGRGGMGAVYRGKQAALDRAVAIKLLPAELAADTEFMTRFQREARTLARLQHPGIVAVHDFGQTSQGHLYFVMEFVNGTDLSRLIHGPGINPVQALEVITQICDALQYAHSQGVIHRDIKPANVLINQEGRAKLADFGLARPTSEETASLTRSNVVMGTPDYMAPEQMAGNADHRADLYALGVMLYEMLTGQTPRGAWAPPSQRVQVDVRLDQVVVRALQQDPAMRYQQASEIKTDVDVIRTTPLPKAGKAKVKPASEAPGQRTTPLPKAKKPRNKVAWVAAVVVLLALGAAIWFFQHHQTKDSTYSATKEAPFVNSLGMKFVPVPGADILMCIHETRRKDYASYADEVPGVDATWKNPSDDGKTLVQGDDHPVVEVSWDDAAAFCAWLSKKEGCTYRLPTEREWNLAAAFDVSDPRSISDTDLKAVMAFPKPQYPWGTRDEKDANGNYKGKEDGYEGMAPVMSFLPNRLGIFDLGGNAWEWCEGWLDKQQSKRVLRGCGYMNHGGYRNSLTRQGRDPGYRFPVPPLDDYSRSLIPGFRMVVERSPSKRVEQAPTGAVPDHSALGSPSWHKLGFFGGHQDPELIRPDADGWIRTGKENLHVTGAEQPGKRFIAGDTALRFRLLWTEENIGNQASLWFRSETKPTQPDGLVILHFSKDSLVFSERDRELPLGTPGPTLREVTFSQPFKAGDEALLEIIGIGDTVYARVNGQQAQVTTSNLRPKGWITLGGWGTCFKDAEYLHLDSLPDPLKALGWEVESVASGPAAATKETPFTNSLGMKFVPVPITGGPTNEQRVLFSVSETRVRDFEAFVQESRHSWSKHPDFKQGPDHAVICVNWNDAQAFCAWLTNRERNAGRLGASQVYRLPTDHEWSCAVGIGDREDATKLPTEKNQKLAGVFPWGNEWPPTSMYGNYSSEELRPMLAEGKYGYVKGEVPGYRDGQVTVGPVGGYAANGQGLHDLGGNAWEWCEDWYDKTQKERVLRGASWHNHDSGSLLSSHRWRISPDNRGFSQGGFRCVLAEASPDQAKISGPWQKAVWHNNALPYVSADGWFSVGNELRQFDPRTSDKQVVFRDGAVRAQVRFTTTPSSFPPGIGFWLRQPMDQSVSFGISELELVAKRNDGTPKPVERGRIIFDTPFLPGDIERFEAAVVGDTFIVRFKGKELRFQDPQAVQRSGPVTIHGRNYGVKDVEYAILDGISDPLKALGWDFAEAKPRKEKPWRDFLAELADGPSKNAQLGRVWTREGAGWRVKSYHTFTIPDDEGRDLAIRATGTGYLGVFARDDGKSNYSARLFTSAGLAKIQRYNDVLKSFQLGPDFDASKPHSIELVTAGNTLRLRVDEVELGLVQDDDLAPGARFGVTAAEGSLVEKVEYRFLDVAPKKPAPATPSDAVLTARERGGRLRVFGNNHRGPVELGKAAEFDDFRTVVVSHFGWAARREGGDTYCMAGLESSHVGQAVELGPFLTSFLQRGKVPVMQMRTDGSYRNLFSRGGSQHRKEWADHRAVAFLNPGNYILSLDAGGKILRGEHWYGATVTDRISPPADFFLGATAYTTVRDHYIASRPGLPVRSFNVKTGQVTDFPSSIQEVVEMDATADEQVIMRDGAGQVFVVTPDGKSHGSVPPDIGPAVAVRAGANMFAAQRTDGTWRAWGESESLVAQTTRLGHAVDIDFHSEAGGKISYMLWIEPVVGSAAVTPASANPPANITATAEAKKRLVEARVQLKAGWQSEP